MMTHSSWPPIMMTRSSLAPTLMTDRPPPASCPSLPLLFDNPPPCPHRRYGHVRLPHRPHSRQHPVQGGFGALGFDALHKLWGELTCQVILCQVIIMSIDIKHGLALPAIMSSKTLLDPNPLNPPSGHVKKLLNPNPP